MSLLERLKKGTDNKKTIVFPGTSEEVVVSVLSEGARQEAHFAAEQHFKRKGIEVTMSTADAYETERTIQILYRALSDQEEKPLARTVDEFRNLLTVDEKDRLVDEYLVFENECSPNPEKRSESELENLYQEIKKKPETIGSFSSIGTARQLISYLVNRLASSPADSGSIS
jgi:hypothetical protein